MASLQRELLIRANLWQKKVSFTVKCVIFEQEKVRPAPNKIVLIKKKASLALEQGIIWLGSKEF